MDKGSIIYPGQSSVLLQIYCRLLQSILFSFNLYLSDEILMILSLLTDLVLLKHYLLILFSSRLYHKKGYHEIFKILFLTGFFPFLFECSPSTQRSLPLITVVTFGFMMQFPKGKKPLYFISVFFKEKVWLIWGSDCTKILPVNNNVFVIVRGKKMSTRELSCRGICVGLLYLLTF